MAVSESVAGVVFAGGASSRMGRDKATLAVAGTLMAVRVAQAMRAAGLSVFVVGGKRDSLVEAGLAFVDDRYPGDGPLGAIVTALGSTSDSILVSSCDTPILDEYAILALLETARRLPRLDAVTSCTASSLEPLFAVYRQTALAPLADAFDSGVRSPRRSLQRLRWAACSLSVPEVLLNVNTPADLVDAERRLSANGDTVAVASTDG